MRLTSLVLVVSTFAFAETRSLPSVGVGIGVGANTSSRTVEAPVVIFGGASLVREERTRMETSAGVTLVREPVVSAQSSSRTCSSRERGPSPSSPCSQRSSS